VNGTGSRRVRTLVTTITRAIDLVRTKLELHAIKLLKVLATTVKAAFLRLVEDDEAMEHCSDCELDKRVTKEDKNELMGLIQFIIHGISIPDKKPGSTAEAFEVFKRENEKAIAQRVELFKI